MTGRLVWRAVGLAVALGSALSAHAAQDVAVPASQWAIDYGSTRCSLARRQSGAGSPILALETFPGGGEGPQLAIRADSGGRLPAGVPAQVDVVLLPSDQRFQADVITLPLSAGPSLLMRGFEDGFVTDFAASASLRIEAGGLRLLEIELPDSSHAVAALVSCNNYLMRALGLDPAALAALKRRPRQLRNGPLIRASDYPPEARRRRNQGMTVMRLAINPQGRVVDCVPVQSSGSEVLDRQSCSLTTKRARFHPALDANGTPAAAHTVTSVMWLLPE